jgi:hypothetical protein
MKRALWITLIAVALLCLAAVGWIVRRFDRPSQHEPTPRRRRRERLVLRREARPAAGSAGYAR